jgi:hypothetical protein
VGVYGSVDEQWLYWWYSGSEQLPQHSMVGSLS